MRLAALGLCALLLVGCSSTGSISKAQYDQTLVAGAWRVDCRTDEFKAERTCWAGTFGESTYKFRFFQIQYINGVGPSLSVPHDFPGRIPTVRVDDGPVLTNPKEIATALLAGKQALVTFHVWPTGEERMIVAVTGFAEAYEKLRSML